MRTPRASEQSSSILDAYTARTLKGGPSFTARLRLTRLLFMITWFLCASWTPPALRGWRRIVLNAFGAKLARGANVYSSCRIWHPARLIMGPYSTLGPRVTCYNQAEVTLEAFAIVSQDATLCAGTHDYNDPEFQLITRPITLQAHSWVAAEAFVGPGVCVGTFAVLGARGVAMRDLAPHTIFSGNPAVAIKKRRLGGGDSSSQS